MRPFYTLLFLILFIHFNYAQVRDAPDRQRGEGPWTQLIIRGVTLINGNGAPPTGPVDIVVENNRIKRVANVGYPGVPIKEESRPKLKEGGKEIDCNGMFLLPGFVDMHGHIGGKSQGADAEYVFKLWMAHGITTIRDPACGNGLEWVLDQKERSNRNEITAPRIKAYSVFAVHDFPSPIALFGFFFVSIFRVLSTLSFNFHIVLLNFLFPALFSYILNRA